MHHAAAINVAPSSPALHATASPRAGDVRLLPFDALGADDLAAWATLGARSSTNVFAQPWVVAAGLRQFATANVRLAFVSDGAGTLVGVVPLVRASRLGRLPLRHWQVWSHANSFCAPVLMLDGHMQLCWDLLLAGLAAAPHSSNACAVAIAKCPLDSDHLQSLRNAASEQRLALSIVEQHQRALAAGSVPLDSYWDTHVRAKKRKELRRQASRLAEMGALDVSELAPESDPGPWIEEFLALERQGWKGAAGSALAAAPGTETYFREVVMTAQDKGCLSFLAMRLEGRAIAMLVTLFDGDAAFSFKTAYDESLARFSPGVQIQRDNLFMLARRGVLWADSCAAPDHPMIDSIWAQRRAIGTVVVGLPGTRNRLTLATYRAALNGWRAVKRIRSASGSQ